MLPSIKELREAAGGLPNLTDEEIISATFPAYQQYYGSVDDFAKAVGYGGAGRGMASSRVSAGIDNYQAGLLGLGGAASRAVGLDGAADWFDRRREANEQSAAYATQRARDLGAVDDWREVDGVGSGLNYLGGLAAQSLPYLGEAVVGGLAARGLATGARAALRGATTAEEAAAAGRRLGTIQTGGAVAASYPSAVGDILSAQREAGGEDLGSALLGGVPYAALNAFGVEGLAARGFRPLATGQGGLARRMATGAGVTALGEGIGETGQELTNQYFGRMAVDPNETLFNDEANQRYLDSFIGGAALGGVFGGAGGIRRPRTVDQGQFDMTRREDEQQGDPLQLGFSPLAGTPIVFPDGSVALNGEQELQARYNVGQPAGTIPNMDETTVAETQQVGKTPTTPTISQFDEVDQGLTDVGIPLATGKKTREKQRAFYQDAVATGIPLDSDLLTPYWTAVSENRFGERTKVLLQNAIVQSKKDAANVSTPSAPAVAAPASGAGRSVAPVGGVGNPGSVPPVVDGGSGDAGNTQPAGGQAAPVADAGVQRPAAVVPGTSAAAPAAAAAPVGENTSILTGANQATPPAGAVATTAPDPFQVPDLNYTEDQDALEIARLTGQGGVAAALEEEAAGQRVDREVGTADDAEKILAKWFEGSPTAKRDRQIFDAWLTATRPAGKGVKGKINTAIGKDFGIGEERVGQLTNIKQIVETGRSLGYSEEQVYEAFGLTPPNTKAVDPAANENPEAAIIKKAVERLSKRIESAKGAKKIELEAQRKELKDILAGMKAEASEKERGQIAAALKSAGFTVDENDTGGWRLDDSREWQKESSSGNQEGDVLLRFAKQIDDLRSAIEALESQGLENAAAELGELSAKVNAELEAAKAALEAAKAPAAPKREVSADLAAAKQKFKDVGRDVTKMEPEELRMLRGEAERFKNKELLAKIDAQLGAAPAAETQAEAAPAAEAQTEVAPATEAPKQDSGQTLWESLRAQTPGLVTYEELTDNERGYLTELADRTNGKPKLKDELGLQELMGRTAAPKVETTDAQRKDAEDHAKELGGTVVWQEGPLALIRGYSMLSGQPVYAVAKGTARSSVDVERFTGNAITPEQKARLVQIKKDLEAADAQKHANDPFIKFDKNGLATSSGVDPRLAGVVAGWKNLLNIKANIYVTTLEDARADKDKFTGPHRAVGSAGLDANEAGSMRKMGDGYYIAFKKGTSYLKMLETLGHELGHVHQREAFDNADPATQKAIRAEHDKFVAENSKKTGREFVQALRARSTGRATRGVDNMQAGELSSYWKSFSEWYADQVSKWATTSEKPVGVVEQFFAKLGAAIKKFYYALKGQKYLPNQTMKQFLDAIADRTIVIDPKVVNQDTRSEAMFVGVNSLRTLPKDRADNYKASLARAKVLDAADESPADVFMETGWFKGLDGKWRSEIIDRGAASLKQNPSTLEPGKQHDLSDVLDHKELFLRYPALRDLSVVVDEDMDPGSASFDEGRWQITMSPQESRGSSHLGTVLHEVQHAIQGLEGFAQGGNPDAVNPFDRKNLAKLLTALLGAKNPDFKYLQQIRGLMGSDARQKAADLFDELQEANHRVFELSEGLGKGSVNDDLALKYLKARMEAGTKGAEYNRAVTGTGLSWSFFDRLKNDLYRNIAGEAEAFDTEARLEMNDLDLMTTKPRLAELGSLAFVPDRSTGVYSKAVPKAVQPQVTSLTKALKVAKDAALNTIVFSEDLFKRAASMGINAAMDMDRIYRERAALTGNIEREVTRIEQLFNRIPKAFQGTGPKSANQFLYDSTREGKWGFQPTWRGATGTVKVDPEMEARFKAMPKEARAWVEAVFEHGDKMLALKKKTLVESTNSEYDALIAAAKADGNTQKAEKLEADKAASLRQFQRLFSANEAAPYAPMRRFGNWVVSAKSKEYLDAEAAKDTKRLGELQKDPDHYHVSFAESYASALELQRQLQAEGHFAAVPEPKEKEKSRLDMYGGLMDAFNKLRGNIESELGGATDPKEIAALKAARETVVEMYLQALAENSARKSEMRRRGVSGEIDMLRSFSTQGRADAHFLAAAKFNPQAQQAVVKMRQQKNSPGNETEKSMAFNEVMARHEQSMKYEDGGWFDVANKASRVTSVWLLATNPMYYLQNLTQPFVLSLPFMTGKHDYTAAAGQLMRSYFQLGALLKSAKVGEGFDFSKVSTDKNEQDMVLKLVDRGRIDIGMDTELGKVKLQGDNAASRAVNRGDQFLRSLSQKVEAINRVSTALAAYRLERKAGASHEAALEYADQVIAQTHGDYTRINAPRAFNTPIGKVALQFRKFQLIQLTLLSKLVYNSFKGASAGERAAARKMLTYTLGHTGVLAGVVGMPGFAAAAFVINKLADAFGDDDEPYNLENELRKMLGGGELAQIVMRGAPNLVGTDLSGKLGMGNALSILPYTEFDASREGFNAIATGLTLGATGGLGARVFDALGNIKDGDYYRGLMGVAPTGVSGAIRAYVEATRGETNKRGDVLVGADEISNWESFAKAIGWPTTAQSERRFDRQVAYDNRTAFENKASKIKNEYARAVREKDAEARREAIEKWQRLQKSRREAGFQAQPLSSLMKAPQEQAKRERNTAGGVQFNRQNRQFVMEQTQ